MARKKKYSSNAERQRAYRERKAREKRNKEALQFEKKAVIIRRPPVRYYGGKWRIGNWIIGQFPEHTCYCEPFCGGASVFFRKKPSKFEVLNDLNNEIVNFFDVLRSSQDELIRAIKLTPHSRYEHRRAHEELTFDEATQLERARRFYVRSRQSFGTGEGDYNSGWRYSSTDRRGGASVNDEWRDVDFLYDAAERLLQAQIECDDAVKVIKRFDTDETLFYVDPPYLFSTRYSNENRYAHEMTEDDHRLLAECLHDVDGMVIISGYDSELYRKLYADWTVVSKPARAQANAQTVEFLWVSPKTDAQVWKFQGVG